MLGSLILAILRFCVLPAPKSQGPSAGPRVAVLQRGVRLAGQPRVAGGAPALVEAGAPIGVGSHAGLRADPAQRVGRDTRALALHTALHHSAVECDGAWLHFGEHGPDLGLQHTRKAAWESMGLQVATPLC